MRRAIVLGGGSPLGRRVTVSLRECGDFDSVVAIEARLPDAAPTNEGIELVTWAPDHRPFADYLVERDVDTVVDCSLVGDRSGRAKRPEGADVIATMYVGAAISDERSPVRSWILASSSAFYTSESYMPLLHRETSPLSATADDRSRSIGEAEEYARGVARRHPHLNVAILRLQELAGAHVPGPLADLLSRPWVPFVPGFDPPVQFLHVDDAVRSISWAAEVQLAGLYNVASEGLVRWSEATRSMGRRPFPILPVSFSLGATLLEKLALPVVHASLFGLLRYGSALDIAKIAEAGWRPAFDQAGCLAELA